MAPSQTGRNQIQSELTAVFHDVFQDPSMILRDDLTAADVDSWDSLTHIHLIIAVERAFRVKFSLADISGLKNVGQLIALIDLKAQKGQKV
jgi:acyl carrier protein